MIVAVDGQPVRGSRDLFRYLDAHDVGDEVRLRVRRGRQEIDVDVTLQLMP